MPRLITFLTLTRVRTIVVNASLGVLTTSVIGQTLIDIHTSVELWIVLIASVTIAAILIGRVDASGKRTKIIIGILLTLINVYEFAGFFVLRLAAPTRTQFLELGTAYRRARRRSASVRVRFVARPRVVHALTTALRLRGFATLEPPTVRKRVNRWRFGGLNTRYFHDISEALTLLLVKAVVHVRRQLEARVTLALVVAW